MISHNKAEGSGVPLAEMEASTMQINGIQGGNAGAGQMKAAQITDSVSKNIRNQIVNVQKQMQELSSNKEMSAEDKMKKRQEYQQQIFELQNQLRQHEIELRREAQEESSVSMEDMLGGDRQQEAVEADGVSTSFSDAGMQAMVLADSALSQAKAQGSVATSLKGRAGVLKSEIKLDAGRGASVEMKQKELAAVEQRALQASSSQVSLLGNAVNALKEASDESTGKSSENRAEKMREESVSQTEDMSQNVEEMASVELDSGMSMAEKYNPVNILL